LNLAIAIKRPRLSAVFC